MNSFHEKALCLLLWRAIATSVITVNLMLIHTTELRGALLVCADMALMFSLVCAGFAGWLTDDRITKIEPWLSMSAEDRPAGSGGRRWAHNCFEDLLLRFAKAASGAGIVILCTSLCLVGNA